MTSGSVTERRETQGREQAPGPVVTLKQVRHVMRQVVEEQPVSLDWVNACRERLWELRLEAAKNGFSDRDFLKAALTPVLNTQKNRNCPCPTCKARRGEIE